MKKTSKPGQSRLASLSESLFNVAVGYIIAVGTQILIFPLFGIHIPLTSTLAIGVIFTVVSILRSYVLRRVFNWAQIRPAGRGHSPEATVPHEKVQPTAACERQRK